MYFDGACLGHDLLGAPIRTESIYLLGTLFREHAMRIVRPLVVLTQKSTRHGSKTKADATHVKNTLHKINHDQM